MPKPINFGIIGTGNSAQSLFKALKRMSGVTLQAVAGSQYKKTVDFAQLHGIQITHPQWEQMIKLPNLHAVIIATPDNLHAEMAMKIINEDIHVFLEKPMTTDLFDLNGIECALQKKPRVKFAVGYHHRWHNGHRAIQKMLAEKFIGEIESAHFTWITTSTYDGWRNSSTNNSPYALSAIGTHIIDLADYFLRASCGQIIRAEGILNDVNTDNDTSGIASLQFESGTLVQIHFGVGGSRKRKIFEIFGSKGSVRGEDTFGHSGSGFITYSLNKGPSNHTAQISFANCDPYYNELRDFVEAISENRQPEVDFQVGALNTKILSALFWEESYRK